jgi:16S rRNA (guanine1207-N2)-methyltransferase
LRPVARTLLEALPKKAPRFLVTGLDQDGRLGLEVAARHPESRVLWFHHDLFPAGLARFQGLDAARILVAPDLAFPPDDQPDLIALPFPKGGEALLSRELVEQAHDALAMGGRLIAATDGNPAWLKRVVKEVFRNSDSTVVAGGAAVFATRKREDTARKDHSHVVQLKIRRDFAFRTRPGVFSYGHVDQGSKALLALADLGRSRRILDIGCGVGVLGIVAAASSPGATAVLVDSNVRAVALARENADRNEVAGIATVASADPITIDEGPFDCVLANPPYFANFKIAVRFIGAAHAKLEKGGRLWLVAKAANEHAERVERIFGNVEVRMAGGYGVISARKLVRGPGRLPEHPKSH